MCMLAHCHCLLERLNGMKPLMLLVTPGFFLPAKISQNVYRENGELEMFLSIIIKEQLHFLKKGFKVPLQSKLIKKN